MVLIVHHQVHYATNASGTTVTVYNGVTLLSAVTVTGSGWSYSATIVNGTTYQFNVIETDSAGNAAPVQRPATSP